jgi:hypothetical protein
VLGSALREHCETAIDDAVGIPAGISCEKLTPCETARAAPGVPCRLPEPTSEPRRSNPPTPSHKLTDLTIVSLGAGSGVVGVGLVPPLTLRRTYLWCGILWMCFGLGGLTVGRIPEGVRGSRGLARGASSIIASLGRGASPKYNARRHRRRRVDATRGGLENCFTLGNPEWTRFPIVARTW